MESLIPANSFTCECGTGEGFMSHEHAPNVGSEYDDANRRTKITYPDGTIVDREYTDRNQLEFVKYTNTAVGGTLNAFQVDGRVYDNGMRLSTVNHGNGIVTSKTYRNDNLTQAITRTGLTGADFTYAYDANKNKTKETISGVMQPFGFNTSAPAQYDDEDRLTGWNRDDSNKNQTWNLSKVGDWDTFAQTGTLPFSETRTHGATHELTNITGGLNPGALIHDAKGNITGNSNGQAYGWDFDNQLSQAVVPAGSLGIAGTHNYTYDALGRRVSKTVDSLGTPTTIIFVSSGQQVVAEYASGQPATTALRKYIHGTYIDERCVFIDRTALGSAIAGIEELFYYHTNNLYSVTALTTTTGTVQERYAYDAYGNILYLNAAGTPLATQVSTVAQPYTYTYTYTGRRLDDETGLFYYRARYYDADLGRFIGRDPIGYRGSKWNLYEYAQSLPTVLIDPSGLAVAASCSVAHGDCPLGKIEASPLFYHRDRGRTLPNNRGANGIGISIHYIPPDGGYLGCSPCCVAFKFIQVVQTNWLGMSETRGSPYVDNRRSRTTPFYGDVYLSGPPHPSGYPAGDANPKATHSIYDKPYRNPARNRNFPARGNASWSATTCIVCVRNGAPDIVLKPCISYGFTRRRQGRGWADAAGQGPTCTGQDIGDHFQTALDDAPNLDYDHDDEWIFGGPPPENPEEE